MLVEMLLKRMIIGRVKLHDIDPYVQQYNFIEVCREMFTKKQFPFLNEVMKFK